MENDKPYLLLLLQLDVRESIEQILETIEFRDGIVISLSFCVWDSRLY